MKTAALVFTACLITLVLAKFQAGDEIITLTEQVKAAEDAHDRAMILAENSMIQSTSLTQALESVSKRELKMPFPDKIRVEIVPPAMDFVPNYDILDGLPDTFNTNVPATIDDAIHGTLLFPFPMGIEEPVLPKE